MRRILIALLALAAVALAACRQYDVDVYRNVNGWTPAWPGSYVTQSFTCTADSLLWAEFFVGAENSGGSYQFDILAEPNGPALYTGDTLAGPGIHYSFVRARLRPVGQSLLKGKEYVLKVTCTAPNESLNWYADTTNPYQYGRMFVGGDAPLRWDLCARIEGVNRGVSNNFFGVNSWYTYAPYPPDSSSLKYAEAESAGCSWIRELLRWDLVEWSHGTMNWMPFDSAIAKQYRHGLQTLTGQTDCPSWASCHFDSVRTNGDTAWSPTSPPRGLYEPVETLIGGVTQVNPRNYWGNLVYQFVTRYKHGSAFWSSVDANGGIDYIECWNEPNYWKTPNLDTSHFPESYGLPSEASLSDSIALVKKLYARLCDVTMAAVHLAGQSGVVKVLVGSLGGVELEQEKTGSAERLVKGKDWLRGYYQYRESTGTYGVTVHPYQYGDTALAFRPGVFARDLDTIRAIMQANGESDKPLWATELGYDNGGTDEMLAALSIPECYVSAIAGIGPRFYDRVLHYVLEAFEPPQNTAAALLGDSIQDFARRPSFYAYRQMTQELLGKRMNGRVLSGDSATDAKTLVYELEDTATHKKTWVGWRNYADRGIGSVGFGLPARTGSLDRISLALAEQRDSVRVQAATSGWLSVALGDSAVYVRETGDTLRPDLRIDSVWTSFVPGPVWPQQRRFHAKVHNAGTAFSPAQDYNSTEGGPVNFYANGQLVAHASHMAGIMDGEAVGVESDDPWEIADTGSYLVRAAVNESRTFVELGFDNNSRYRMFQILPVYKADGGANGARAMARATGSSPIQAVAEFVEGGKPMVYYCPSLDSAASDWYSLAAGNHAALSLDAAGNPWVVYLNDSCEALYASVRRADSTWTQVMVYSAAAGQRLGAPALAVFHNQGNWRGAYSCLGNVVFPVYQNSYPPSYLVHCRLDTVPGQVFSDVVDNGSMTATDSAASLCCSVQDTLYAAYQSGSMAWGAVYCRMARYDTTTAQGTFWSPPAMLGSTGFVSSHPCIDQAGDRIYCIYVEHDMNPNPSIQISRSVHFTWNSTWDWYPWGASSWFNTNPKDWPTSSGDLCVCWAESLGGNWEILARVGWCPDTIVNLSRTSADSKYPHVIANSQVGASPSSDRITVHCLWSETVGLDTAEIACNTTPVLLGAADPNATRFTNSRKLMIDPATDSLFAIYTMAQGLPMVGIATAATGNDDWHRMVLMLGDQPGLGRDSTGMLWAAFRGPNANTIWSACRPANCQAWCMHVLYDCSGQNTWVGAPAIAGNQRNPYYPGISGAYVAFPVNNYQLDSTYLVVVRTNQWNVTETDTIDRTGLEMDSLPSIGVQAGDWIHVIWQRNGRICSKVGYDTSWSWMRIPWSAEYVLSDTSVASRHSTMDINPDTLLVAWTEGSPGRIKTIGQPTNTANDAWGDTLVVCDGLADCDFASICLGETTLISYQEMATGTYTGYQMFVNAGLTESHQVTSDQWQAEYCDVVYQERVENGETLRTAHCIWSEQPNSGFYDVGYTAFVLPTGGGGGGMSAGIFDPGLKPMLYRPAPNPFSGTCCLRYCTNVKGMTRVTVMDITGRRVRNLLAMQQNPGIYNLTWNARDDRARKLPRGVYFVRLETANYHEARKVVIQ